LLENLNNEIATVSLYFNTSLLDAPRLTRSALSDIINTKTFKDWTAAREAKSNLDVALVERIDNVVRAVVNLGKALAGR
jgi:hypothetical protein